MHSFSHSLVQLFSHSLLHFPLPLQLNTHSLQRPASHPLHHIHAYLRSCRLVPPPAPQVEGVVPVLIELKRMLSDAKHPLLGELMACIASMLKDYKAEIEDILVADKQVG